MCASRESYVSDPSWKSEDSLAFYDSVWGSPSISYVSYVSCECCVFVSEVYLAAAKVRLQPQHVYQPLPSSTPPPLKPRPQLSKGAVTTARAPLYFCTLRNARLQPRSQDVVHNLRCVALMGFLGNSR